MARLSPFINKLRILSVDLNDAGEVLDCAKEVLEGHELQTVFVALTDQERQEKRAGEARRSNHVGGTKTAHLSKDFPRQPLADHEGVRGFRRPPELGGNLQGIQCEIWQ